MCHHLSPTFSSADHDLSMTWSACYRSFLRNVVTHNALTTSSLLSLSLSVLSSRHTHNRFDACPYKRHRCLSDGFILQKRWELWVTIVGSLTLWLRGTKLQESISPASCCLDTALHCLQGYFKPFKDIRVRVYIACMWTQPRCKLPICIKLSPLPCAVLHVGIVLHWRHTTPDEWEWG